MPQQTESNTIRLVHPGAGQIITVPINADYIRLSLGFEPDPNAVLRNGQNLEFVFEDGGKIVLQGYYYYFASKTLPVIVTESGDEMAGEDFLASLREELLTAAAPEIISSSSGGGEYVDDAGDLVESVARISPLGAIYLDQAAEESGPYFDFASTGYATGSSSFITLRPTPPEEWPDIPGGPGYQISVSGTALTFDEAYLQDGSVAGAEGGAINGKMVFEIAGNDALASLTVNGTNYTVGSNGVIAGLVGQMFADADGGCCSITQASVVPGATLGSSYLIMEFILDQPHGHAYGVQGPDQIELLGEVVVIAHSVNGAISETVSGTVSVIDDVPSVDYVVDSVYYSRPEGSDKSEMLKIDFGGTADEAIPGGALVLGTIPVLWGADGSESLVISHQESGALDLSGLEFSAKSYGLNGGTLTLRLENDELKFEFASQNLEGQGIIENLLTITATDGDGDKDSIALHLNVQNTAMPLQGNNFIEGGEAYMTLVEDAGSVAATQSSSYQTLFASMSELGVGDIMEGNSFSNGGSDSEVLYGGLGDDVMFGSDGLDIFAWMPDEIDNGYDQILDFRYGSDMLRFDSLLREGEIGRAHV